MKNYVAIIPARAGSKGIPHKNIRNLAGKPLIAWTIESAKACPEIDDIVISTDSPEIADICSKYGGSVSSLRPSALAQDETPTLDVIKYEIDSYEQRTGDVIKNIVLLQPTSPLRLPFDIASAISLHKSSGQDSLISVTDSSGAHPSIMYEIHGEVLRPVMDVHIGVRRQDMKKIFIRNGAIYITSSERLKRCGSLVSETPAYYEMPKERSINIDELFDFDMAEWLLKVKNAHS
jgi:CMP-N,N'-diacetyllegionaminic acid synthase